MITLDVRGLPPCEPFDRTLAALDSLPEGEQLVVLIHREPFPLYALLDEQHYQWTSEQIEDAEAPCFRITISHQNSQPA